MAKIGIALKSINPSVVIAYLENYSFNEVLKLIKERSHIQTKH